ncbi:MAG: (deoxy)nucleoside triphosphate pyrophosphohydrolase [Alphaproteobacteria bacterium]|nr:(deoxy)nucleoside triphosphate pyrophosphohydrolase [Alphaproteobacteria bacterium]
MSCFDDAPAAPAEPKPLRLVVAGVMVDGDGRVLIQQRPADKSFPHHWEFPGGKIEPNETPEAALVRELQEELGIDTKESCLAPALFASHGYDSFHLLMPVFILRQWRGIPRPITSQQLRWLPLSGLDALENLLPADRPLLPLLRQWL